MNRRDAFFVRQSLVGRELNGALETITEPYRSLAKDLAGFPEEARQARLDVFLADRDDREEIIRALADVDPDGPAPAVDPADATSQDTWGSLRLGEMPAVEAFPDIVLPDTVADFVRVASDSIGCPPDFVGVPVLIVAGAAIGRSASLLMKPGYFASSALYAMNVGGPSSGKSPAWEDPNPSFAVDPGKGWWRCYGCGEAGDAAALVMKLEGVTFPEAVAYLADGPAQQGESRTRPRPVPRPEPKPAPSGLPEADALALVEDAEARLWTPEGADGLAYLAGPNRCLDLATIRSARLGWTPRAEGVAWKPPGVVISWFADTRLALVKVRPPDDWREQFPEKRRPPKYIEAFRDPARLVCYPGPDVVRVGHPVIVVEGELDALLLGQELGEMASIVSLGSASSRPSSAMLGRFLTAAPWLIATDADLAGDLAAAAWPAPARRVRPPGSVKDWTQAKAGGVNLTRWWRDILAGADRPPLFSWDELARLRWGPAAGDPAPGIIVVDRPDRVRMRAALERADADRDPDGLAERKAIQAESDEDRESYLLG